MLRASAAVLFSLKRICDHYAEDITGVAQNRVSLTCDSPHGGPFTPNKPKYERWKPGAHLDYEVAKLIMILQDNPLYKHRFEIICQPRLF